MLELGLVAAVEADAAGRPLSAETWQLLARMLDAALAVVDVRGRSPRQNDGDEGRAIVVDDPELDPWAVAVGSGVALLGAPDWAELPAASVQAVLFGAIGRQRRVARATSRPETFPDAGLTVLRSRPTDGPEIWCRCDGGPHGFLAIAAHAHADALSVELRHDGIDILADPGTYCYHGEPAWRDWLRSTAAHNTLEVGGVDQAESGGPFLWTTTVHTTTLAAEVGDRPRQTWTAEHDGYRRLATPTTHRRSVTLDSVSRRLVVQDSLDADQPVPVTLAWQLGPEVDVEPRRGSGRTVLADRERCRRAVGCSCPAGLDWSAHRGELDPIVGWYSPRFGSKVPSWTLLGRGAADSATALVTEIELP